MQFQRFYKTHTTPVLALVLIEDGDQRYRVVLVGDHVKPLYEGTNAAQAQRTYDEIEAHYEARKRVEVGNG